MRVGFILAIAPLTQLKNFISDFRSVLVSIATHPLYAQKDVTM